MEDRNFIDRYAEPVKEGYSVLREDVVVDSELVQSVVRGSPAPTATVTQYEEQIKL